MKKITDFLGRVFGVRDIENQQTDNSQLAHLHRDVAGHPTRGLTPAKLASIMQDAEQGNLIAQCELGDDIEEKDGHIFAELQKRKRALLGVDWRIVPPKNPTSAEMDDCALIEEIITDMLDLDDVVLDMADGILKGFSQQEIDWAQRNGVWYPREVEFRESAWFQLNPTNRNDLRLRDGSYEGAELQPFGWISHRHKSRSGYLGRAGLVRVLSWPFLFKALSTRDLAEFLEVYGLPAKIGRYPSGVNEKEKATLLRAVLGIGHNAAGIIPKSMDIEFKEAAEGGEGPFMAMINWAERTQSKAILGGTLTSGTGDGTNTNALGNVHNEVRKELRDSDLKQIANTLSRDLVYPLYALNCKTFQGNHRLPRFEFDLSEAADIKHFSESLPALVDRGMKIPLSWLYEQTQIPVPADDEPVLQSQSTASPVALTAARRPGFAVLRAQPHSADQQALDAALDTLDAGVMNEQVLTLLQPVFALAGQGPEALRGGLAELWPDMNDEQLEQRLISVLFAAELWGELNGGGNA